MKINKLVQFEEKVVDVTELDADIKTLLKENGIVLKSVKEVNVYIKPEAKYVVVVLTDETKEFILENA